MIESEVIDVRCGEPHVTAEQIMDVNIGTYGDEDYVLSTGKQVIAELVTNNSVRVFDGVMVYGGIRDAVPVNKYYDIPIDNGAQGKNRNDIIVRRFTRGEGTSGTGAASFAVVKGVPVSGKAVDPEITVTDLREGALTHDMPLHRVRLEGLNIVAVEPLYKVLYNMDEIQKKFTELSGKLAYNDLKQVMIGKWGSPWDLSTTDRNIGSKLPAVDNDYYKTTTGADAAIIIKQAGMYVVGMYSTGVAVSGASANIVSHVMADAQIGDDGYVLYNEQYSYNELSACMYTSRTLWIPANTVLTMGIRRTKSSGNARTTGSSYMDVIKIS